MKKTFKDLPEHLQKFVMVWASPEHWGKKMVDVCREEGFNYNVIRKDIAVWGTQDFYEIKAQLVMRNLTQLYDLAAQKLQEKIEQGNTKALEMFWKLKKEIYEKVELSGSLDLNLSTAVENAFNRVQELEEDEK